MIKKDAKEKKFTVQRKKAGKMLAKLHRGQDQRHEKIRRIRSAVEELSYENNLKLEIAIDRLFREL